MVAAMTPAQAMMYAPDLGQVATPFGADDGGGYDSRFGTRVRRRPFGSKE